MIVSSRSLLLPPPCLRQFPPRPAIRTLLPPTPHRPLAMGCVQARGPTLGSPDEGRLDALKRANGYMPARDVRHLSVQSSRRDREDGEPEEGRGGEGGGVGGGEGGGRRGLTEGGENEGEVLRTSVTLPQPVRQVDSGDDELVDGWPRWLLSNVPPEVLAGLVPKSADNYEKLDKVGQGTYSNVYKARDRDTGKIVALKKVRFDTSEPESVKFMAREIMILQKLDHPNVMKLEGLATSRMHYSIYLVFEFMQSDLARIISRPDTRLTEPQVKCYMKQLLSGLQHCHERGILHRDIKGSNLLIDKNGVLKIADFGLANFYYPKKKVPLTSRVVTLWYRAPELLLGTTDYGHGIDLWSAGCLLAEMFAGRPIMPGRNEIEQLHKIFMLCGSPSDDYWKKLKLANRFQPPPPYKPSIAETFKDLPSSALILLTVLLSLDPANRSTAASALESHFFTTSPQACDLSGLPIIYNEVDELIQPRERKKNKVLKLTHQSRRERCIQTRRAAVNIKGYSGSSKEPADLGSTNQELGGNAGSTSSSIKPQKCTSILGSSFLQITCPYEEDSQRAEDYPSGPRNIKNFSPKLEWNVDSYDLGKRSSSTMDLGRFPGRHMSRISPDMQ